MFVAETLKIAHYSRAYSKVCSLYACVCVGIVCMYIYFRLGHGHGHVRGHGHGHGHWVFILAMYPKGKSTTNPNKLPKIPTLFHPDPTRTLEAEKRIVYCVVI
jgi:hypothetical protein